MFECLETRQLLAADVAAGSPPTLIELSNDLVVEGQVRLLHNPAPQSNFQYGWNTAADGNLAIVGTNNLSNSSGETYVYNYATGDLVSTLPSPTPEIGERFGENVAISGNRAVVSARLKDVGAPNAGEAYVFNASSGALLRTLVNPSPASVGDEFGVSVAISGTLIAIGSNKTVGTASSGAVHLFSAVTGNHLQTIANPTSSSQAGFGRAVSISGGSIVVGAFGTGQAFIYDFNPTTQVATLATTLDNPPPPSLDLFGWDVSVAGNIVAIGAWLDDAGAVDSGQVHLFNRTTGNLLRSIDNPSPNIGDNFGQSVTLAGAYLAVSAPSDDTAGFEAGRVYVFEVASGNLVTTISNPAPGISFNFGSDVSFEGSSIIVGRPYDNMDGPSNGLVYVFSLPLGAVVGNLATSDPDIGDTFSFALLDNAGGRFALQGTSIVVADPIGLNFEANTTHTIVVMVTDSAGLSLTQPITINVVDVNEPPTDITIANNSVAENSPNGTVAATLSATDPDVGSTHTFSLLDSAGGRFAIQSNTIVVANSSLIDFETNALHTVIVRATDALGKSTFESVRIAVTNVPDVFDYGDLPDTFGTAQAASGARHELGSGLFLGTSVTSDADGQPDSNASLDVGDDGVVLPSLLVPGMNAVATLTSSQAGKLDAFIDFNGNGLFDASERITPVGGLNVLAAANTLSFAVPLSAVATNAGARFRISTTGGLGPTGDAQSGEVEDYRINIVLLYALSSQVLADPEFPGQSMLFVKGSAGIDTIAVNEVPGGFQPVINGNSGQIYSPSSRVVIFGYGGGDDLRINGGTLPSYIDGGADNDTIRGGNGPDTIYGRGGNDFIYGRDGFDTIYGGNGDDTLYSNAGSGFLFGEGNADTLIGSGVLVGGNGNDQITASGARNVIIGSRGADTLIGANANQGEIIVGGYTNFDADTTALAAIQNEWKALTFVSSRIAHLDGSVPGGLNGSFYLNATTVFQDDAVDTITNFGSTNVNRDDWIFLSTGDVKLNPPGIVVTIPDPPAPGLAALRLAPSDVPSGWSNADQWSDVNGDGVTSALDALLIINRLNSAAPSLGKLRSFDEPFYDVSQDGKVSPLDALLVINRLNTDLAVVLDNEISDRSTELDDPS